MTITRDENNRPFAYDAVAPKIVDLMNVEIGRMTVSNESVAKIRQILELDKPMTEEELRGIRNAVVRIFGQIDRIAFDESHPLKYETAISGITAVIDNEMWNRGYRV